MGCGFNHNFCIYGGMIDIIEGKQYLQMIVLLCSVLPAGNEAYATHGNVFYGNVLTFTFCMVYAFPQQIYCFSGVLPVFKTEAELIITTAFNS